MLTAKEVRGLAERLARAEALVAAGAVFPISGQSEYLVVKNGDGSQMYLVHLRPDGTACCSCPDFTERQSKADQPCKHILSAELFAAVPKTKAPKTATPQAEAEPQVLCPDGRTALARLTEDEDAYPISGRAA